MTNLFTFGNGTASGDGSMKELLGGKGAGLAAMAKLGLPIPFGVTIPTSLCNSYREADESARKKMRATLAAAAIKDLKELNSAEHLPLLSARSGARVSMPGMMDTILNVGITTQNLGLYVEKMGERAALDSYRRLIQMYASTVDGLPHESFEEILADVRHAHGATTDADLSAGALDDVVIRYKKLYSETLDAEFPDTIEEQLAGCIGAVFDSWDNERAIEYRLANKIPHDWGTAVTIQQMVFGNLNDQSATGVLFTRDPNTGEPGLFGEFLVNAQGEDVVAGIRTPEPLADMKKWDPNAYDTLQHWAFFMEAESHDMQDMEFTVEDGTVYILQTRNGKRSAKAAFRIAHDLVSEGMIDKATAVKRVTGKQYVALKRPAIAAGFNVAPTVTGLPAAGAVVTGVAVMSAADAKASKEPCVLVTEETTPDDFGGMMASVGILTRTGGATSHAAVVARGMDKCCVVGASAMKIGTTIKPGDMVTLDGATGRVWVNTKVPVQAGGVTAEAAAIASWAREADETSTVSLKLSVNGWEKQIPQEGFVVLDVSDVISHKRGRLHLQHILNTVAARKNLRGVFDFVPVNIDPQPSDEDMRFLSWIGGEVEEKAPVGTAKFFDAKVPTALFAVKLKGLSQWSLRGLDSDMSKQAQAHGYGKVRHAAKMGDLIDGAGMVSVSPTLAKVLTEQGVNLQTFLDVMKAAGQPVALLPEVADEDSVMFQVLGK